MNKTILLAIVVVLLGAAVTYLALDRHEKEQAAQHTRDFKSKYLK